MYTVAGKYGYAEVYADTVDETALEQLRELCDLPFSSGCKIRVMPDVHAGNGCVIGFTADMGDMVIPSIVGMDIGCGMLTVELGKADLDFDRLDRVIRERVPSGMAIHDVKSAVFEELGDLLCYDDLKRRDRIEASIGTLGGGNHFIEIDADCDGNKYLVIHTGSRNLGVQIEKIYQRLAYDEVRKADDLEERVAKLIAKRKAQGREKEIEKDILLLRESYKGLITDIPYDRCYLTGRNKERYLNDMAICQRFAQLNRKTIADAILSGMSLGSSGEYPRFQTVHNYINFEDNIVRKGAVSARKGEILLIPINMRDGALICRGKGNSDWNNSAPHGAGRVLSRTAAKAGLSLDKYRESMEGIYTTCVCENTIDESPMAYKSLEEIKKKIFPTVEILKQIKPLYNFKATD